MGDELVKIREAVDAVQELIEAHPGLFRDAEIQAAFGEERPCIGDWSDPNNRGMLVTGDGIGQKSGVYCFASPSGDILYIGKATKNNLHHRVWGHVKTPQFLEDGRGTFPKHGFRGGPEAEEYESDVREGRVRLGVITISDQELASLAEVYLHVLHKKMHSRLPIFNKQIG